jgi:hypothetical protein
MARVRPSLTTDSFLGHLFSPSKNALPTGIRKHPLKAGSGRKAGRLAAYNRMSPFKQEVLRRSGQREAYLKGDISFRDAKEALRGEAVTKKLARPLRIKPTRAASRHALRRRLDTLIADRIREQAIEHNKSYSLPHIIENVQYIPDDEYDDAVNIDYPDLRIKGRDKSYDITMPDGTVRNPYWYH